ncbi:SIMPL domain-containing protein [Parvibaculum sp.]|uniref:SIMPL domain-containing protein n=1 Tax=Parvibaculum sp. TaxID=2024848 RepID=UPI002730AD4B|nr:SIMPL domain-containing protein [Parvibaculum sp.]MDP1626943.1 SIMPL domain-containing protein [Parvibaculum sp.]MDP2151661.1 SIMPL domain-containing protein [Parvibaculum sp.]MDP3328954.1 SIMPL domain-containing protein [Parvibaculum sp.]
MPKNRTTALAAAPLALIAAMALFLGAALATPAHAQERDEPRIITITGEGKATAAPDIAYISTGVVTEGKTAAEALAANTKAMAEVFAGLKDAGIAEKDMQTSQFSVYPVYEQQEPQRQPQTPKIGGYRVQNQLTVTVRDLAALGGILDKVVSLGSNQMNGINFSIDKPEPLLDEARKDAVKDALRKAKLYAGAAGVSLGQIVSISENGSGMPQPYYAKDMMMRAEASSVPVAAGEQTITASVNLVIKID